MAKRRSFSVPRVWQYIGVGILAVAVVAMVWQAFRPVTPPVSAEPRPAVQPSDFETPATGPLAVAVIGDSFTGGSGMDSGESARWPALLTDTGDWRVTTYHEGGTGYAATLDINGAPSNFVTRVDALPTDVERLVFFGSINDGVQGYDATRAAAEQALTAAKAKLPDAQILVIGPASPRWPVPAEFATARDATRDAAAAVGVTFVDPIELGWFSQNPEMIGADGTHPNDAGHAYLATELGSIFASALD